MKTPTFVDTLYVLALVNPRDHWHARAVAVSRTIQPPLITTQAILTEIADALARQDRRAWAVAAIDDLRADPDVECVAIDQTTFDAALALYRERPDKDWGLTDCVSFVVMRQRRIDQALTADMHFVQAGFRALMLP